MSRRRTLLSIVIPVYCNDASLRPLHEALGAAAAQHPDVDHEIVFVDDGSEDGSFATLTALAAADARTRVVRLTRNFGSHSACLAGLSVARGDAVAIIAADLQEPPDLPWRMLARWSPETPVVLATRRSREDDWRQQLFANLYHGVMRRLALPRWPSRGFDCFLADRRVVDHINAFHETNASLGGLVLWTGFGFAAVDYDRVRRPFGRGRWTLAKRVKLFIDSIVSFSYAPIRVMSAVGVLLGLVGFAYAAAILVRYFTVGPEVTGWSSLMAALMVVSGVQLVALGVLGEYVWRALDAARGRPRFIIGETRNVGEEPARPAAAERR